jgi:hypothetical protein
LPDANFLKSSYFGIRIERNTEGNSKIFSSRDILIPTNFESLIIISVVASANNVIDAEIPQTLHQDAPGEIEQVSAAAAGHAQPDQGTAGV